MRKICFFTGTRAEYGLLRPVMQQAQADPEVEFQLLVSGTHIDDRFGFTRSEIDADHFVVSEVVDLELGDGSPLDIGMAMGRGVSGYTQSLSRLSPDILVVLGDRYEALAVVCAASVLGISVAHLYGGELTFGAMDDAFRHAITKMSHLHFTSTEEYRKRVIQMGEAPRTVHRVGALGVENIKNVELLSRDEVERSLGVSLEKKLVLGTYHPVTLEHEKTGFYIEQFLQALDRFPDVNIVLTKANADSDGAMINGMLEEYASGRADRVQLRSSLGLLRYLSVMKFAAAVVGNSSSGLIETPSFGIPTVNIGSRQDGRTRAESVIDCEPTTEAIVEALEKAFSEEFAGRVKNIANPYEFADTSRVIYTKMREFNPGMKKGFYDISWHE